MAQGPDQSTTLRVYEGDIQITWTPSDPDITLQYWGADNAGAITLTPPTTTDSYLVTQDVEIFDFACFYQDHQMFPLQYPQPDPNSSETVVWSFSCSSSTNLSLPRSNPRNAGVIVRNNRHAVTSTPVSPVSNLTGLAIIFHMGSDKGNALDRGGDNKDRESGIYVTLGPPGVSDPGAAWAAYIERRGINTPSDDPTHQPTKEYPAGQTIPGIWLKLLRPITVDDAKDCQLNIWFDPAGNDVMNFRWSLIPQWDGKPGAEYAPAIWCSMHKDSRYFPLRISLSPAQSSLGTLASMRISEVSRLFASANFMKLAE